MFSASRSQRCSQHCGGVSTSSTSSGDVFDAEREDGLLLLEEDDGRSREVSGVHLGTMQLADERTLRLAVLSACEGARLRRRPLRGRRGDLIQREIPAVVAMRFEITDRAALVSLGEFYAAVADRY